jgi:hypothetical protein
MSSSSLHSTGEAMDIWGGKYKKPLEVAQYHYETAREAYYRFMVDYKAYVHSLYSEVPETTESPAQRELKMKVHFMKKAMTYASTLFSAINNPLYKVMPSKSKKLLSLLREVVGEITKHGGGLIDSTEKEVVLACVIELSKKFRGVNENKSYFYSLALKLIKEILGDEHARFTTIMLTFARISSLGGPPHEKKAFCKKEVYYMLEEIRMNPEKISRLDQDWKTYVRIARMLFAWKHMFFGLKHDRSRDLHLKSYAYYARFFYKRYS